MDEEIRFSPALLTALKTGNAENIVAAATPGGIEAQEARGQQALVNSAIMPKAGPWMKLAELGGKRLDDVDDLFCNAELPEGWAKQATDHSMWSDLVDGSGKKVGSIFYKAAFYDRRAHFSLE